MNASIKDVARGANVSVATVSRALNGHRNVTEEVRSRVLAVAKDLRYSPHHAARSLSSRCTRTIGVVLPDLSGDFFSELMRGVDQCARQHGMHLLVSSYHGNPREQTDALRAMRGRVDGVLWMSPYQDETGDLDDDLTQAHPVVLINTRASDPALPSLIIDNHSAAAAMVRHLVEGKRRRIAFISGPPNNFDASGRLQGYRDALAQALPEAEPWVVPGDFSEASGHYAAQQLLAAAHWPDAIFAANEHDGAGFHIRLPTRRRGSAWSDRSGRVRRYSAGPLHQSSADNYACGHRRDRRAGHGHAAATPDRRRRYVRPKSSANRGQHDRR